MPQVGVSYRLGDTVYLALTNDCNTRSLIESRGPGFVMPAASGFAPLARGYEPSADDLVACVEAHVTAAASESVPPPRAVCFAGAGEPLLRLEVLLEAATRLSSQEWRSPLELRVNTNGLVPEAEGAATARRLRDAGISRASVLLGTAHASQYQPLMRPRPAPVRRLALSASGEPQVREIQQHIGHAEVCAFVRQLVGCGVAAECTAVAAPEVDLDAVGSLAHSLGATFRPRTYHPRPSPGPPDDGAGPSRSHGLDRLSALEATRRASAGSGSRPASASPSAEAACEMKARGNGMLKEDKLPAALGCYREAVAIWDALAIADSGRDYYRGGEHAICCANQSLVLCKLGRADEALEAARRAVALNGPSYRKAYHRLGSALALLGRQEEAAAAFEYATAKPLAFIAKDTDETRPSATGTPRTCLS